MKTTTGTEKSRSIKERGITKMTDIIKRAVDKVVQIYMENDYDYVVSLAKAGKK